jgi:hypothetical protein
VCSNAKNAELKQAGEARARSLKTDIQKFDMVWEKLGMPSTSNFL